MLFLGKKRKKEQEIDEAFAKVYQEIETIDNWNDHKKLEHYILDSCEQIIALTKPRDRGRKGRIPCCHFLSDGYPDH